MFAAILAAGNVFVVEAALLVDRLGVDAVAVDDGYA